MSYKKVNKKGKPLFSFANVIVCVALVFCVSTAWAEKPSAGKAATELSTAAPKAQSSSAKQPSSSQQADTASAAVDDAATDSLMDADSAASTADLDGDAGMPAEEGQGFYKSLKTKFIEGNAGFMSFVALALVLGLAFCIDASYTSACAR